jgi:hypothetical protein
LALFALVRLLIAVLGKENNFSIAVVAVVGFYVLFVITSWVINPVANFTLLFNKDGKYALTNSEKWSAITSVGVLVFGALMLVVSYLLTSAEAMSSSSFIPGLICLSLALPLSNMQFPITFKTKTGGTFVSLVLVVLGLLSILMLYVDKEGATFFMVVYFILFIGYNWTGLFRR